MTRLSKWLARVKMPAFLPDMFHPSNPTSMFASHKPSQSSPKDTATTPHTLHYVLVLDRSGSMMDRMDEVRHAVNDQIATLRREAKEDNNSCLLTVVRFDTEIEPIVVEQNVQDIQPLTAQDVQPRGMTALVDATVLTIEQAALQIGAQIDGQEESLAIVVYTDGGENASRHRSGSDLTRALEKHQNLPGWDITFIGASPEAFSMMERAHFRAEKMVHVDAKDSGWAMREMTGFLSDKMRSRKEMAIREMKRRRNR